MFRNDRILLEQRGSLIIKQLSIHLNSIVLYRAISKMLVTEQDVEFASLMVQALNLILLTAAEVGELRAILKCSFNKSCSPQKQKEALTVFSELYNTWCHNPVATFSLCLLSQAYDLSAALVLKLSELDVTVGFLLQVDKLLQLIESPIFIHTRIQLLDPGSPYLPDLLKSLYGLLMILPQTGAYKALRERLDRISKLHILLTKMYTGKKVIGFAHGTQLKQYEEVQQLHSVAVFPVAPPSSRKSLS